MNISNILKETQPFTVEWNGQTVTGQAYAHALTPALREKWRRALTEPMLFAEFVSAIIESWDITEGKKPFPPTVENIAISPLPFIEKVLETIGENWTAAQETKANAQSN